MAKTSEVISKLQKLVDENGDQELTIYKLFDRVTRDVKIDDIHFDDDSKDIYIATYN